jgi:hypothetical protein
MGARCARRYGAATALMTSYVKLNLGIPGHAIVLAVLPIALGMAFVPRRFAGSIMSASAAATMAAIGHTGFGAIASMLAIGVLDLALRKARPGITLCGAFILAGFAGNVVARVATKLTLVDSGLVVFSAWWAHSLVSYAVCGAFAGLVSVAMWFHLGEKAKQP